MKSQLPQDLIFKCSSLFFASLFINFVVSPRFDKCNCVNNWKFDILIDNNYFPCLLLSNTLQKQNLPAPTAKKNYEYNQVAFLETNWFIYMIIKNLILDDIKNLTRKPIKIVPSS